MIKNIEEVRRLLYERVLRGKDPSRDLESVEDHDVDWLVLDEREFQAIKRQAEKRRHAA